MTNAMNFNSDLRDVQERTPPALVPSLRGVMPRLDASTRFGERS